MHGLYKERACHTLNKHIREPEHNVTNTDKEGVDMNWTKKLPEEPGYYWISDRDEDGSTLMSIVEVVQMPDDKELIEELMEFEDPNETEVLIGKLVILSMGDSFVQLLDDPDLESLSWYGPLAEPEAPAE